MFSSAMMMQQQQQQQGVPGPKKKKKKRVTPVSVPTVVNSSLQNAQRQQPQGSLSRLSQQSATSKNPLSMVGSTTSSTKGPAAGSVYAFELDVRDGQREFVLSELHPMGFPKRRRANNGASGDRDMAKIAARLKAESLAAAKAAYRSYKGRHEEKKGRSAFEIFAERSGAREEARAAALALASDDPAPGWRRIGRYYVAPTGEVVRSSRDVRKYIDRHLKSTRTAVDGKALKESHFSFREESTGATAVDDFDVDREVLRAWQTTVDKTQWEDMARAEESVAAQTNLAVEDEARRVAAKAASSVGVDLATAASLAADAHKPPAEAEDRAAVAAETAPEVRQTLAAHAAPTTRDDEGAASGLVQGVDSASLPMHPPSQEAAGISLAKKKTTKKKKAPAPDRRYNVVERLERLFGGGELAESGDEDDSESLVSYYASDDSFIDDSEIVKTAEERDEAARTKPAEFQGFFASTGDIATETVTVLPTKKKVKSSSLKRSRSSADDGNSLAITSYINEQLERDAPLAFVQVNPKRGESALRYETYKKASSFRRALDLGATKADLRNDLQKGYITSERQDKTLLNTLPTKKTNNRPSEDATGGQKRPSTTTEPSRKSPKKKVALTPVVSANGAGPSQISSQSSSSLNKSAASSVVATTKKKPAARRVRCGACPGCLADECGVCKMCLDRPKRGGENKYRQPCIRRTCVMFSSSSKQNPKVNPPPPSPPIPSPVQSLSPSVSAAAASGEIVTTATSTTIQQPTTQGSSSLSSAAVPPAASMPGTSTRVDGEKPVVFVTQS